MLSLHRSSMELEASKRLAACSSRAEKPWNILQYMYVTEYALESSHRQGWTPTMQLTLLAWYTLQCRTHACCAPKAIANFQCIFSDATACAMQV